MSRDQAGLSVLAGYEPASELFSHGVALLGTGHMGIANAASASAIGAVITREFMENMRGRGAGIGDTTLSKKCQPIRKGIELNAPDPEDPLDILPKRGGVAGAVFASAHNKMPGLSTH
nr:hypothetical protein [Desulfobacterales bacterium]